MQTIRTLPVAPVTYLKAPLSTELGKRIVVEGLQLIHELGFESFTFKKLADRIGSTEASVYRYFTNKHMFLAFLSNLYWSWMESRIRSIDLHKRTPAERLDRAIHCLVEPLDGFEGDDFPYQTLTELITVEGPKVYLTPYVDDENKEGVFLAYKHLCSTFAGLIGAVNPTYPYAHALASTVIEASHYQLFFSKHLPRLTDIEGSNREQLTHYLQHTVASAIC